MGPVPGRLHRLLLHFSPCSCPSVRSLTLLRHPPPPAPEPLIFQKTPRKHMEDQFILVEKNLEIDAEIFGIIHISTSAPHRNLWKPSPQPATYSPPVCPLGARHLGREQVQCWLPVSPFSRNKPCPLDNSMGEGTPPNRYRLKFK